MIISLKMFGTLADGVDPDRAQQVAASDPGRHFSLHIEIKMNSFLLRIVGLLRGV